MIGAEVHPRLALSPTSINFGDVPVGFSVSQVVTLRNSGNATVMVMSATITGAGFSHDLAPPFTLAAGEFRSFNLSFNPMTAGSVMGMLSIVSDAENTPTVLTLSGNGVGPGPGSLNVSPTSITYGDTVVGTAATQTAMLVNNGGTTVTVTSVMVTGAGFNVMGVATPFTVDSGQTVSFTVQFFPVAAGAAAGSISIVSDAPNSPANVTLAGNGVAPVKTLSANPTSIDFGDVTVGSNSAQAVMVTNTGNTNVMISASSVSGAGFTTIGLTPPITLTPGQTTSFMAQFAPAATGNVAGSISITSDATNSPTNIALTGNGTPAPIGQLAASPTSIDYGSVIVGNTTSQPVTISNTGNANLNVTAANVTGAGFSITPPLGLPLTLTPGQSMNFTVQFAPASAGAVAGSVSLVNNGATTPVVVTLSGMGVAQVLQLDVSPSSIDFGDVNTGSMATQSVMMTNSGNVNLSVTAANVTGAGFSINPVLTLPVMLTPGQSASFTVQFAPGATGAVSGSVSLVSNATNSPTVVTLDGNGTTVPVATLNASPTSVDFGDVVVGNTASQVVTITNVGNATATIMTSSISGAGFSVTGLSLPLMLTPGQSTNFTVQFMPGSAGNVMGNVTLNSNAGNTPHILSLTGNGVAQVLQLNVNPMDIDFGDVTVGNTSTMSGVVTNVGNVSVTITSTTVSTSGGGFSFNPAFTTPVTLMPGETVGFTLQFAPGAAGMDSGTASFISNASNSPTSVNIQANALAAPSGQLDLNPMMINYGMVVVGSTRDMAVMATNSGTADVTITAANVTGAAFSITPALTLPVTLMPGQNVTFNVRFAPSSAGGMAGSVSLVSDASNSPTVLTLSGTGVAQVLQLSASPTSINFGDVTVGGTASQSITLTNTGNVSLNITQANVTGSGFSTTGLTVPLTLNPGQSTSFTARFMPSATGMVGGSISIVSNATNSPTTVTLSGNGTPAPIGTLTVSPTSINFGSVIVGNMNSQLVTLTNTGTASLMVTSSMVTGAGFSTSGLTLPLTLSIGQSTSFTAQFMPASGGAVAGSISLVNDGSISPRVVSLSGTGVAQVKTLSASPTSINFGNVTVGMMSAQMVTVTNTGNVNVNITSSMVTGAGFGTTGLALPLALTPGQSTSFTAQFAPPVAGNVAGSISLTSDATNSPTVISLMGNGTPPPIGTLTASPTSINFGSVIVGNMNGQTVTLMNTGTASLMITSSSVTGAGFSITGLTLPLTLSVGQSTSFTARFMPASAGGVAGNISLVNTGSVTPVMVSLSGTGVAQVKTLSASPTSINFGNVTVGMTGSQMVTVTNTGNVNVNIMSSMVTGAGFSTTGLALPLALAPGQSTMFSARFMPSVAGSVSGNISLTSDATNSPTVIMLMGNGTPPPIGTLTASPTSINFGSVIVGNTNSQTVMLTNTGTASLTINSSSVTGAGFSITGLTLPLTLTVGQSTSFTARFMPASAGGVAGNISLVNTGSVTPVMVSLSGTGVAQVKTLSANPTTINFGSVTLGSNNTQMVTVTNTGNVSVMITASSVTGTGFSASGLMLPRTLTAGQSFMFSVTFNPPASGAVNGSVSLTSDASNSPTNVTLSGTGVAPAVNLTVSPLNIDFGDVVIGSQASQAVTLLNSNATSVTVNNIAAMGPGFSVLAFDPNADPNLPPPPSPFPFTLFPGQSTSFAVSLMPLALGPSIGSAVVTSSAGNSPATVTLSGNGVLGVILAWDPSASVVVGYEVLRATKSGGPYTILNATPIAATTFSDTTVTSGRTFFYAVRAVDATGQKSALSNEIMVTLP